MPSDAARREALGETVAVADFRGYPIAVPLDVEAWPTALIRRARWVEAVDVLLDGQWFGVRSPVVDDYRDLSDALAAAVGVERKREDHPAPDRWFGGVPTLLRLLDLYEPEVEADLKVIGVDYLDRWRGALTLRQIWVHVRRSAPTSAIALADNDGKHVWTEADFIMAGLYQAWTGKVYPGRPLKPEEFDKALEAMRAKAERADKLRAREAHYAPQPPPAAAPGLPSAMAQAIENRRRELGEPTRDHP